jgi:hypothetical protein
VSAFWRTILRTVFKVAAGAAGASLIVRSAANCSTGVKPAMWLVASGTSAAEAGLGEPFAIPTATPPKTPTVRTVIEITTFRAAVPAADLSFIMILLDF